MSGKSRCSLAFCQRGLRRAKADWIYSVSGLPTSIDSGNSNFRLFPFQNTPLILNSSATRVFADSTVYVG